MFEIENWNGHRVLAIPVGRAAEQCPVTKAYLDAVRGLSYDLGATPVSRRCGLCPMYQVVGTGHRCAHPIGVAWTALRSVARGGCRQRVIVAEEYIPLVQMRLGEQA